LICNHGSQQDFLRLKADRPEYIKTGARGNDENENRR
jgi:hypothetical protein